MTERGKIYNREYAAQLRDFSGLRYGKITPTDIDGFMDFGGKAFVFIEAKYGDSEMPFGQKLALERLCDACDKGGINAVVLVASHNTREDIDFAAMTVTMVRHNGVWRPPRRELTVRQTIDAFLEWTSAAKLPRSSPSR